MAENGKNGSEDEGKKGRRSVGRQKEADRAEPSKGGRRRQKGQDHRREAKRGRKGRTIEGRQKEAERAGPSKGGRRRQTGQNHRREAEGGRKGRTIEARQKGQDDRREAEGGRKGRTIEGGQKKEGTARQKKEETAERPMNAGQEAERAGLATEHTIVAKIGDAALQQDHEAVEQVEGVGRGRVDGCTHRHPRLGQPPHHSHHLSKRPPVASTAGLVRYESSPLDETAL
jgi:hypothetical protein